MKGQNVQKVLLYICYAKLYRSIHSSGGAVARPMPIGMSATIPRMDEIAKVL